MNLSHDYPNLVLYQDESILVVDKPAGVPTLVDGYHRETPFLAGMLNQAYGRVWVVHRLDRDTSGVIVFARTAQAHRDLNTQFEQRRASKVYHALVIGQPVWDEKSIDLPLRPNGDRRHRTVIDLQTGKPAVTKLRVLERYSTYTLIEAIPLTGRTHQIRAHLLATGYPLLADRLYRQPTETESEATLGPGPIRRLGLHARSLTLAHPLTNKALRFEAPYPPDFVAALKQLRQYPKA